jgi:hypothetical protein
MRAGMIGATTSGEPPRLAPPSTVERVSRVARNPTTAPLLMMDVPGMIYYACWAVYKAVACRDGTRSVLSDTCSGIIFTCACILRGNRWGRAGTGAGCGDPAAHRGRRSPLRSRV